VQLVSLGTTEALIETGGIRDRRVEEIEIELLAERGHPSRRYVRYPDGQPPQPVFDSTGNQDRVTSLKPGRLGRPANRFRAETSRPDTSRPV